MGNENKELNAKMSVLEPKLNQILLSNYYTKSKCDNQYAVKLNIEVLEERHYEKGSDGYYKITGHSGEHFIIHGVALNGDSFNLDNIINEGEMIRLASGDYILFNQSADGQNLVCNAFLQNIYYNASYTDKEDEYVHKSIADETYQHK